MKGMGEADEGHLDMYFLIILDMYRCPTKLMSVSSSCLWVVQLWLVLLFAVCKCVQIGFTIYLIQHVFFQRDFVSMCSPHGHANPKRCQSFNPLRFHENSDSFLVFL